MVLQRFSSPVNTLLPKKATTPVTFSKPISVMTLLTPPMTRRMTRAAKCQSKPIMKRKMTRLTAWTNKETLLQCMQHYIQYNGGITVPLRSVPHLCINPSVVPPTEPQLCPHCGGRKFSNIL